MPRGGIIKFPYSVDASSAGSLDVDITSEGYLTLTIYNPKTNTTLTVGGDDTMVDMVVYKDDVGYNLMFEIDDADGDNFNLTGGSVKFQMGKTCDSTLKVDEACVLVSPTEGQCVYTILDGDLDTCGDYIGQLKITISDKIYTIGGFRVIVKNQFPGLT